MIIFYIKFFFNLNLSHLEDTMKHSALAVGKNQPGFLVNRNPLMLTGFLSFTSSHAQRGHSLKFGFLEPFFHSAKRFAARFEF